MKRATTSAISRLKKDWYKAKHNQSKGFDGYGKTDYDSEEIPWWQGPKDVVWVAWSNNEEDYEGSQTQIGVREDGTLVWEYQSHCSCNSYGDSETRSARPV